jgi:toxin ParE1/3/4
MAEIRWTEEAADWLREIHDYIAQDSPSGAAKVVSGIYERASNAVKALRRKGLSKE